MKKVIFTIFVMVFLLLSCVVSAFAYSENSNPGVYVVSPNGGYSLTTPSSTKLSSSAMQQFALDLYTPEFVDSFVIWRTDSSHVGRAFFHNCAFSYPLKDEQHKPSVNFVTNSLRCVLYIL